MGKSEVSKILVFFCPSVSLNPYLDVDELIQVGNLTSDLGPLLGNLEGSLGSS